MMEKLENTNLMTIDAGLGTPQGFTGEITMDAKTRLEAAKKQYEAAMTELNKAKEQYDCKVEIPEMRKRIGQCFRYRNNDGASEPSWTYARITGVDGGSNAFHMITIQRRSWGGVELKTERLYLSDEFHRITRRQFDDGIRPIMTELKKLIRG